MKLVFFLMIALLLTACDSGVKQMGPGEYGVIFRRLPPALGGGVSEKVKFPGQMAVLFPWDSIITFETSTQDITWGGTKAESHGESSEETGELGPTAESMLSQRMQSGNAANLGSSGGSGFLNTRAYDGNEVALAVTVRYQITSDPKKLVEMVEKNLTSDEEVRTLVVTVARADIRTHMNYLKTAEFLDEKARYQAVDSVRKAMNEKLEPLGITVGGINLNDFRFERLTPDGSIDASYQDRLKEIQKLSQDTEREKQRVDTVQAKKQQEMNEAQGVVNRQIAEAEGLKNQAKFKGDSYYEAKLNEAKAIRAQGEAEVKGLQEKISALSGPGGQELLKLELAKQLLKNDPKFIVLAPGSGQGLDLKRTDTNQLLNQFGIVEALRDGDRKGKDIIAEDGK